MTTANTASATNNNAATENQTSTPEVFIITTFKQSGGIDVVKSFLEQKYSDYSEKAASEVPDVDTEGGRKRIKALAAEVNKKLSELDTPIRDYLRDIKKQPKLIEAIAKENKEKYTSLRADILKPLEDAQVWQDEKLAWLNGIPEWCAMNPASEFISQAVADVEAFSFDEVWPELKKKFKVAHEAAMTTLTVTLERIELAEQQAARLAELEAQAEAQRQKERDRQVAEEAAQRARDEADEKARKEREDIERRAVEAKQREEAAKAAEQKAIRDAELAEERRKQDAIDAENRRIAEAEAAEARQAAAIKREVELEAKRIADEEAEQKRLTEAREANKEHRIKINRAAMVDLIAAGLSEEDAKNAIRAIAKREVRNISIQY